MNEDDGEAVQSRSLLTELGIWNGESLGELQHALFTTYQPPEPDFLVNELFPSLLRGRLSGTIGDNECLVGLQKLLKDIKPVIVSSSGALKDPARHAWLSGCTESLTVGRFADAIQHSKLWLVEWGKKGSRKLEVVISSCNLTSVSLSAQTQGVWRCVVPVDDPSGGAEGWAPIPEFLDKLADNCGVPNRISRFRKLFDSAHCPAGVTFVASVPGPDADPRWGWDALRALCPAKCRVTVQAPSVGTWTCADLQALRMPGTLAWVSHEKWEGWKLPRQTLDAIQNSESTWAILQLERGEGPPWLHAKLYGLQSGNWRRLLITSANFSPSAWGPKHIRNFEMGVLVKEDFPFALKQLPPGSQWTVSDPETEFRSRGWADASWDGKKLKVLCRADSRIRGLKVMYSGKQGWKSTPAVWKSKDGLKVTERPIIAKPAIPIAAAIAFADRELQVPVRDLRRHPGDEALVMPGLTKEEIGRIKVSLILARYGGRPLPSGKVHPILSHAKNGTPKCNGEADYSVEAFGKAREGFAVLDSWKRECEQEQEQTDHRVPETLLEDGTALKNYYGSEEQRAIADPGCKVAFQLIRESFELRLRSPEKEGKKS